MTTLILLAILLICLLVVLMFFILKSTVKKIKALWQEKNLLKTSTLSGTALLLHKGFVRGNAAEYLERTAENAVRLLVIRR